MNIFYLDKNIPINAQYHCDAHVNKMITEYAQILSSVYYYTEDNYTLRYLRDIFHVYKLTHRNHPCVIWCRESLDNWLWLKVMGLYLYEEYQYRYNKLHLAGEKMKRFPQPNLESYGITNRPLAMPDIYKSSNAIESYRYYYTFEKNHLLYYTNRKIPEWIFEIINKFRKD
jgi:hypothetical protein